MYSIPRMTDAELREFVLAYCDGRVVTSQNVPAHLIGLVFLPLTFGAFRDWPKDALDKVGAVYSIRGSDHQVPARAINGWPMFCECRAIHIDDWDRAAAAINAELRRRSEIPV